MDAFESPHQWTNRRTVTTKRGTLRHRREKNQGPALLRALEILVGRVGIEPTTNGLRESSFSQVIIQISLLQHTPSSKRSYTQPKSGCKEPNEVTKWLRLLSSSWPDFRIGETMGTV